jgi:class 3 adenylate cyclase
VLSRDNLLNAVAGRRFEAFDRSIDVLVGRLRRKIEAQPKRPRLIITVAGIGYKFAERARSVPAPVAADQTVAAAKRAQPALRQAERRQLTVMRCGIADAGTPVPAFFSCCIETIERFGGIVAPSDDDGVLAWFAHPEANEFGTESAIRAALAVITAVPKISAGLGKPMRARIGIASGPVMIGDPPGGAAQQAMAALGEAAKLAAALLSLAQPDTVLIGAKTRLLVGELFELRALAPSAVAGFVDHILVGERRNRCRGPLRRAAPNRIVAPSRAR